MWLWVSVCLIHMFFSPNSIRPSVLLWGILSTRFLQWHYVTDRIRLSLSEMDWVPWLHAAVPRQGAWRSQLLQEPWPWVPALVLLQTAFWSHRLGLLQLPPGWGSRSECSYKGSYLKKKQTNIQKITQCWIQVVPNYKLDFSIIMIKAFKQQCSS